MVWRIGDLLGFDAQVGWIAKAGFESISFHAAAGITGVWQGIEPSGAGPAERRRIRDMLAPFASREVHAPFAAEIGAETPCWPIDTIKSTIEFASDVGATLVTVHAAPPAPGVSEREQTWHDALDEVNAAARQAGVLVGLEMMSGFEWLGRPHRERIGATLDIGHMYLTEGQGYLPYGTIGGLLRYLGDTLFHLHVHDYDGEFDHIEVGTGRVDFDEVLRAAAAIGYRGALCLELNPERVSPEGIRRSAEFLRRRAAELALS